MVRLLKHVLDRYKQDHNKLGPKQCRHHTRLHLLQQSSLINGYTPIGMRFNFVVTEHHCHWTAGSRCDLDIIIIIIRQPLCPVVGRRPRHAVSKLPCLVLSSVIVSLQYLSRSSLHRLAGLPCRLFLSYGLQVVAREVHRSSVRRLICPAQDHFIFRTVLIISMTFVLSLTQMLVFLSLYVMLSILLPILVCATANLFCACLVSVQGWYS